MKSRTWKILHVAGALLLGAVGAEAATFTVNTTNDTSDIDLGDGICADVNGQCSLRAAIMQANFTNVIGPSNTIVIPAGVYTLTRPGDDDNAVLGDLDIAQTMTLQGAGAGLTFIDGNGAVTGDRVFQILSSAKDTSLSGLTIRNGKKAANAFDEGGGLLWEGGGGTQLHLSDVIFEHNTARYGGGLYLSYATYGDAVTISNVILRANSAPTAAGGGLVALCHDYTGFDLRNSQVYGNTAYEGGGIYLETSQVTFGLLSIRIETTEIYSNTASLSAGFENRGGDANVPVVLLNSHLHGNAAGIYGGAIGNYGTLIIGRTTLDANSASNSGGGIYNYNGGNTGVTNSTISGNVASGSTNAGGGGIFNAGATVGMTNSTLSGNRVTSGSGGGIFNGVNLFNAGGTLNILNCTIASNSAASGSGGGITNQSGTVNARNTIMSGNTAVSASSGPDFAGTLASSGSSYDLFGNSGGLHFSGIPAFGCVFNVNPLLGPLQDNGGPAFTHALLAGSPAIDAGRSIALTTDQRGAPRPVDDPAISNASPGDGSDIGALEFGRPRLAIQKAGSAALLSWPSYYGGFSVQSVTNVILSNAWMAVAGTPVVSGNSYVFTNSPLFGDKFYRLKAN